MLNVIKWEHKSVKGFKANQKERSNTNFYLHFFGIYLENIDDDMRYGSISYTSTHSYIERNEAKIFQTIELQFSFHILLFFLDSLLFKNKHRHTTRLQSNMFIPSLKTFNFNIYCE